MNQSVINKIIKYFIIFSVMYLAAIYISSCNIKTTESLMIGMIAAILFAFIDMYYPSVIIEKK